MIQRALFFVAVLAFSLPVLLLLQALETDDPPYTPAIAPASTEAALALKRIRVPPGLQVSLFAAEPMLANPVAFCIDERGRFFVAETFRLHAGVTDTRQHMYWLDEDLACRTVADRVAMYKKHLGEKFAGYGIEHDRVRLLEDTDGDGKADRSTVFADGFHQIPDGIGAGLLARRGNVWFTCIPDLWLLRDTKGTGKADVRTSLHTGYGVHVGFLGHDLHGLRMGPDGKLYYSIGDRGFQVQAQGRTLAYPDTGAVLRCNPDGSELEVFATGLRNPQELAFDQYGNLFTGDNNSDAGDQARWVYLIEGGDSGWRIGYQFITAPTPRGPWNAEKLWHPQWDGQAAYILPPIANVADGPSGLTYYPGTGLSERYQGHFFLCDFRGSSGISGIRSLAVRPKGASFEMVDQHEFIWSILATDADFGPDGALYLSDWVEGWEKPNKGRIYKISDPSQAKSPIVLQVKKLLAEGMAGRSLGELAELLRHPDLRIRQEAQFALAEKGEAALPTLAQVAERRDHQLARLHAIWGLGQIGRKVPAAHKPLLALLRDQDAEVRSQATKVLGDGRVAAALDGLVGLLRDPEARVRFFAALALGKLGRAQAVPPLLEMLRANADQDAYLRHAGVMALFGINDADALRHAAQDGSASVRLAVLLVLRRLESPAIAQFLKDPEARLVLEAARAINDVPLPAALPQLAALIERVDLPEPLLVRVLNANFRLGQAEHAVAVATLAARTEAPEALRLEALHELGDWAQPSGRDRVMGLWRPLGTRPIQVGADALRPRLKRIFDASDEVRQEAARAAAKLGIKEAGPMLLQQLSDPRRSTSVRVELLKALEALQDEGLPQAMRLALADKNARLRIEGRRVLTRIRPAEAIPVLDAALERGEVSERQAALALLGETRVAAADAVLSRWLDKLLAGQVPLEIRLDLLEAAGRRSAADLGQKLARHEAARPKGDPLAPYREALAGGDARAGRQIFHEKAAVACLRCHKVGGEGGEVGPDLTGIGTRQTREYLLEALVDPNRQIAKGFETAVLALKSGQFHSGVLKAEDEKEVRLMTAEGQLLVIAKDQIEERQTGKSAMPEDQVKFLSKAELRDLVEFLAGLK